MAEGCTWPWGLAPFEYFDKLRQGGPHRLQKRFGLRVVEAMACGLSVVIHLRSWMPKVRQNGEAGV